MRFVVCKCLWKLEIDLDGRVLKFVDSIRASLLQDSPFLDQNNNLDSRCRYVHVGTSECVVSRLVTVTVRDETFDIRLSHYNRSNTTSRISEGHF